MYASAVVFRCQDAPIRAQEESQYRHGDGLVVKAEGTRSDNLRLLVPAMRRRRPERKACMLSIPFAAFPPGGIAVVAVITVGVQVEVIASTAMAPGRDYAGHSQLSVGMECYGLEIIRLARSVRCRGVARISARKVHWHRKLLCPCPPVPTDVIAALCGSGTVPRGGCPD